MKNSMFQDILDEYSVLEPEGVDAWNPLRNKIELWHRIRLFAAMNWALQKITVPIGELKVLDVGCGVGRSTRMLLEFGIKPENVVGIDLRSSAIDFAKQVNPALRFHFVKNIDDWPPANSFHLCMQCTVFSSISENNNRMAIAQKMEEMLVQGGNIFWWDQLRANSFAGSDLLVPDAFFVNSILVDKHLVSLKPTLQESIKFKNRHILWLLNNLQIFVGYPFTHLMAYFTKT